VLILLPPSEGKADPARGRAVDLSALPFAATLGPLRERLVAAVDPALATAPAVRADRLYTGVLYSELDLGSLSQAGRRRAGRQVLIASGLWGLVSPASRVPAYKLPIAERVRGIGGLAAAWRPLVAEALIPTDRSRNLVVDCRSGGYAAVWRPARADHVHVRPLQVQPDGSRKPISHMAKAARGRVTRALLEAGDVDRPDDALAAVREAGMDAELTAEPRGERRWTLDVLER